MMRTLSPALFLLALAACGGPGNEELQPFSSSEAPKQLHVEHLRLQYAPSFVPGSSELGFDEANRLEAFLDQAAVRPNDRVYVATPPGDTLAAVRVGRLVRLLDQRGVGVQTIPPPPVGVPPNHVLMLVDRYVVTPPSCPDWSGDPATGHANVPGSNYGCTTVTNLGLMLDNPRDLVMGRSLAPAEGNPPLGAMQRYRTDQVKPFITQNGGGAPGGGAAGSAQAAAGMAGAIGAAVGGGSTPGQ